MPNLEDLAQLIENAAPIGTVGEKIFDMHVPVAKDVGCGTAACIGGWACEMLGDDGLCYPSSVGWFDCYHATPEIGAMAVREWAANGYNAERAWETAVRHYQPDAVEDV